MHIINEPNESAWADAAELHEQALAFRDAGELERAERTARDAVTSFMCVVGSDHPDHANALETLASIILARGRVSDARDVLRAALEIFELWKDENIVAAMRAQALASYSYVSTQLGAFDDAARAQQEALDVIVHIFGETSREAAGAWNGMGVALRMRGDHERARAAYQCASTIWRALGEELPPDLLHNFAGLACACGDFVEAEQHARAAIRRRRALKHPDFQLGTDFAGLGDALAGQDRFRDAELMYREALTLLEGSEVTYAMHNLADVLDAQGRAREAIEMYEECIALKRELFGAEHHEVVASMNNLALSLFEAGDVDRAHRLIRDAHVHAQRLPPSHPIRTGCDAAARAIGAIGGSGALAA